MKEYIIQFFIAVCIFGNVVGLLEKDQSRISKWFSIFSFAVLMVIFKNI